MINWKDVTIVVISPPLREKNIKDARAETLKPYWEPTTNKHSRGKRGWDFLKKYVVCLMTLLLTLASLQTAGAPVPPPPISFPLTRRWGFTYEGIGLDIYAPYQGYAGDKIPIRVRVEARESLRDIYVYVSLTGSKKFGYEIWSYGWWALYGADLAAGVVRDETFEITIPPDVDSGLIWGYVECKWKVYRFQFWREHSYTGPFNVAYLRNLFDMYVRLEVDYEWLKTYCEELKADYDKLKTDYRNFAMLAFALLITATIFASTTIYFKRKKP